jgi:hypothetical protein
MAATKPSTPQSASSSDALALVMLAAGPTNLQLPHERTFKPHDPHQGQESPGNHGQHNRRGSASLVKKEATWNVRSSDDVWGSR